MKEIDNIVKKVLLESLNEKADEITNKIQEKMSGEMEEWGSEDDFYEEEFENPEELYMRKKEQSRFKNALERLRRKKFGDDEEALSDVELEEADEFDYVAEADCMEGDCGEMEEELHGNQKKIDVAPPKGKITADDFKKLRSMKKETDEEMEEGNAFTEKLKQTKKGGEFKLGGKTYKDTSDLEESFVYSIDFAGENLHLTENELITMIEEIVLEEKKNNLKSTGKSKGMVEFDRVHRKDEDINKKANEESFKKMKDYVKAGSKGSFETNPKHFPKGNGQLAKMDKKAYKASDAVDEYIDTFAYGGGMLDLDPDEIGYNEDWLEKTIEGSAMTGNSPEYANAEDTGYGKKLNKRRKEGLYNKEKRQGSYKRVKQPVDVAGENTKSGKLNKMFKNLGESEEEQKNILSEEMVRMKQMIGYNKNTQ
jgi:hypothetical protein